MNETQVRIRTNNENEIFDILELPDPKSELIKDECLTVNKCTNFEFLVSDFSTLIDLVRLAENGAHRHCEIQIQIRDIGRIITRLAGDTSLAILAFEQSSTEMAESWKLAYEFLLTSLEEEALITLGSIEEKAKEMHDTSLRLKQDANNAGNKIRDISNAAVRQKDEDTKNKEMIETKKKAIEIEESTWKEHEETAKKDIENLKAKINNAVEKIETNEKYINKWGIIGRFPFMFKNEKEMVENERKEKQRLIEEQRLRIAARREANEKIREFSLKMLDYKEHLVLATDVVDSLNQAFSSLSEIEGIIEAARMYWEKTHTYLKQLSTQKLSKIIKNGLKKDEAAKQILFRSPTFKREAVKTYAKCIAVSETCHRYKGQMEENHNNLIKYLRENPNDEQSIAIVRSLAGKLKKNTEITDNRLRLEEEELNEQEANLNNDIQASMEEYIILSL
ncbi:hypothetical protein C1645_735226 [Glomus cerebriforme]|uniref:Uncharacterized protein n=1 Tax=Glomus cerebriforme TaxID=658196 RepID=A0A397TAA8_9GLOM|nr:hypothetical protein C1645_735226 [Glomus cerebriforme]